PTTSRSATTSPATNSTTAGTCAVPCGTRGRSTAWCTRSPTATNGRNGTRAASLPANGQRPTRPAGHTGRSQWRKRPLDDDVKRRIGRERAETVAVCAAQTAGDEQGGHIAGAAAEQLHRLQGLGEAF